MSWTRCYGFSFFTLLVYGKSQPPMQRVDFSNNAMSISPKPFIIHDIPLICLAPRCASSACSCPADRRSSSGQPNTSALHPSASEHRRISVFVCPVSLYLWMWQGGKELLGRKGTEGKKKGLTNLSMSGTMKNRTCEPRI